MATEKREACGMDQKTQVRTQVQLIFNTGDGYISIGANRAIRDV